MRLPFEVFLDGTLADAHHALSVGTALEIAGEDQAVDILGVDAQSARRGFLQMLLSGIMGDLRIWDVPLELSVPFRTRPTLAKFFCVLGRDFYAHDRSIWH